MSTLTVPRQPEHTEGVTREDFVWGWLAANSRSVSIELGLPDRVDSWTLAPLFDMVRDSRAIRLTAQANHDPDSPVVARFGPQSISLVSSDEEVALPLDRVGKPAIAAGAQVTFEYGAHSDEVLCAGASVVASALTAQSTASSCHTGQTASRRST